MLWLVILMLATGIAALVSDEPRHKVLLSLVFSLYAFVVLLLTLSKLFHDPTL